MELTQRIPVNIIGSDSGNPYTGDVIVKTQLTREERFVADMKRREILGPQAQDAIPDLQSEAFMLGQLFVRVIEAPPWWDGNQKGRLLPDLNLIVFLWKAAEKAELDRIAAVQEKAKAALGEMAKAQEQTAQKQKTK